MSDFKWMYESDFINIDVDEEGSEDGTPMFNCYFNFPMSLNLTIEQAKEFHKALSTCLSKIRPQKLSDKSDSG